MDNTTLAVYPSIKAALARPRPASSCVRIPEEKPRVAQKKRLSSADAAIKTSQP